MACSHVRVSLMKTTSGLTALLPPEGFSAYRSIFARTFLKTVAVSAPFTLIACPVLSFSGRWSRPSPPPYR